MATANLCPACRTADPQPGHPCIEFVDQEYDLIVRYDEDMQTVQVIQRADSWFGSIEPVVRDLGNMDSLQQASVISAAVFEAFLKQVEKAS